MSLSTFIIPNFLFSCLLPACLLLVVLKCKEVRNNRFSRIPLLFGVSALSISIFTMPSSTMLALCTGTGMVAGWLLRSFAPKFMRLTRARTSSSASYSSQLSGDSGEYSDGDSEFADDGEFKMVIVVRNDLKMGKGKIAAQCCHAAVQTYRNLSKTNPEILRVWTQNGQPKVVTKVNDEQTLYELAAKSRSLGIPCQFIKDAGRTQITPGSLTVLAVGPAPKNQVDLVTGKLKLL